MRIKKARFFNGYKRFHDLTIDLGDDPKRIVALVGPNGCGKSSVLDGLLFHASSHIALGQNGLKDYRYHSMNADPSFNHTYVSVDFVDEPYSQAYSRKAKDGKAGTIFSFRSPYRYNSNLDVRDSRAVDPIHLNHYGASTAADLDAKIEESYRRLNIKYSRYRDENDLRPSDAKKKILGDLNASISRCLDLQIDSMGDVESGNGTLFFTKNDHPNKFGFNVLSSGEKEVIDILLDLYIRKDDYNDTIFLIDEPELHINTAIQGKLLHEINHLVGENCQIWMTTHSIGFLRVLQTELREECQIIAFDETLRLGSQACTLTPMAPSRANWRKIFSVPLADLADLVSPSRIIYCEGRAEPGFSGKERGMDAQVFNTIFNSQYPDTLFVSSGGSTELDQRSEISIAILSKIYKSLEVLVLKDRDMASGKATSESDRILYLNHQSENHRVLQRWEIENYLFDKDVLKKYCLKHSLTFSEEKYDSAVADIVNQDVKELTGVIKSACGITHNINPEVFKIRLAGCIDPSMAVYLELEKCIFLNGG